MARWRDVLQSHRLAAALRVRCLVCVRWCETSAEGGAVTWYVDRRTFLSCPELHDNPELAIQGAGEVHTDRGIRSHLSDLQKPPRTGAAAAFSRFGRRGVPTVDVWLAPPGAAVDDGYDPVWREFAGDLLSRCSAIV